MSTEYRGTFTVINNTGGPITNVVVTHTTTDFGTQTWGPLPLAAGATSAPPVGFTTSSSNKDRWSVSFINSAGQLRTGQENCGFESEDNGRNVEVILNTANFSIIMPVSSSCDDNNYDQT